MWGTGNYIYRPKRYKYVLVKLFTCIQSEKRISIMRDIAITLLEDFFTFLNIFESF